MNSTDTTDYSVLTLTLNGTRRRAQAAIDGFHADIAKNGVAHAVSWGSVPAMIGELVIDALDRFDRAVEEHGLDRAVEMAAAVREDEARRLSYFDPTSTSTSASASLVSAAEYQGRRAVVEILDEIAEGYEMEREG